MSIEAITSAKDARRQGQIAGLRLLLDWLEDNKDVKLPWSLGVSHTIYLAGDEQEQRAALGTYALKFGSCEKVTPTESSFGVRKAFGEVTLTVQGDRAKTCTAKVVGKKVVKRAVYVEPTYVDEEVDDIEWECPGSLLRNPKENT